MMEENTNKEEQTTEAEKEPIGVTLSLSLIHI